MNKSNSVTADQGSLLLRQMECIHLLVSRSFLSNQKQEPSLCLFAGFKQTLVNQKKAAVFQS